MPGESTTKTPIDAVSPSVSAAITEFLEIVQVSSGGGTPPDQLQSGQPHSEQPKPEAPSTEDTEAAKLKLKKEYQDKWQDDPPHANAARRLALEKLRMGFSNMIGGAIASWKVEHGRALLDEMATEFQGVADDIERIEARRTELKNTAGSAYAKTPEGASDGCKGRVDAARETFTKAAGGDPTEERLALLETAFKDLKTEYETAVAEAELRVETIRRLDHLVPVPATVAALAPGATADDIKPLTDERARLGTEAAAGDLKALKGLDGDISALARSLAEVQQTVVRRKTTQERILSDAKGVGLPDGHDPEDKKSLAAVVLKVGKTFGNPLTDRMLADATIALEAVREEAQRVTTLVEGRTTARGQVKLDSGKVVDPTCLPDQTKLLEKARERLTLALAGPVTTVGNKEAADALLNLQTLVKTIEKELVDLGGLVAIEQLCQSVGIPATDYAKLENGLGGRVAMTSMLKTFPPAELGALSKSLGAGGAGAIQLGTLVKAYGDPAKLKTTIGDLGGNEKLAALVVTKKMNGAAVKTLCDGMGGAFVGALMGPENDADTPVALLAGLGQSVKAFQDLVTEGGFAGKPAALATMYRRGCEKKPEKLKAMCTKFTNKPDRQALGGLVGGGEGQAGLADHPDVLAELFKTGCGGDPANLLALAKTGLPDKESRAGLKALLTTGGLAASSTKVEGKPDEVVVDPRCLGLMLKFGAGEAPNGAVKPFAQQAAGFGKLCKGIKDPAGLKAVIETGGLGRQPEVLGHLIGIGCGGDPLKVDGLSTAFADGGDQANLKLLVEAGGLGSEKLNGSNVVVPTGVSPKCLAKLLAVGCDAKPAALQELAAGLGDRERTNLAGVLQKGKLGTYPEVFGNMYRLGCLNDHEDDDSGQNPDGMSNFVNGFEGQPEKLAGLLTSGGMAKRPKTLGLVMRDAFSGEYPCDGEKLVEVHDAFADSTAATPGTRASENATELRKFEKMIDNFSTMNGNITLTPEMPGKALDNIINKCGLPIENLKTQFYATLKARDDTGYGIGLDSLIQNACTLQNKAVGGEAPTQLPAGQTWNVATGHINERHTRQHLPIDGSSLDPAKPTTLFREHVGSAKVATMIDESIVNLGNALPDNSDYGNLLDYYGDPIYVDWNTREVNVSGGVRIKLGVKHIYSPSGHRPFNMDQWYPKEGSAGTQTIAYNDMVAITSAVRP